MVSAAMNHNLNMHEGDGGGVFGNGVGWRGSEVPPGWQGYEYGRLSSSAWKDHGK